MIYKIYSTAHQPQLNRKRAEDGWPQQDLNQRPYISEFREKHISFIGISLEMQPGTLIIFNLYIN